MSKRYKILWYVHHPQYEGGGERLFLEGQKYFRQNGFDCKVLMYSLGNINKFLENNDYNPKFVFTKGKNTIFNKAPFVNKILDYIRIVKEMYNQSPDILIANSQFNAIIYYFGRLILLKKKIPFVCFIHGSYFQTPKDILKYTLIFRKKFNVIWSNDEEYKRFIPRKIPQTSFRARVWAEIKALLHYMCVKRAEAIFVLSKKNKKELELLYNCNNIIVLHGAFPKKIFHQNRKKYSEIENMYKSKKVVKKNQV